jgi:hypothetical protein
MDRLRDIFDHDDDELAMTEEEWEAWEKEQPQGRPDFEFEPSHPGAEGEDEHGSEA